MGIHYRDRTKHTHKGLKTLNTINYFHSCCKITENTTQRIKWSSIYVVQYYTKTQLVYLLCILQVSPVVCSASADSWRGRTWREYGGGLTERQAAWFWSHHESQGIWREQHIITIYLRITDTEEEKMNNVQRKKK